MVTTVDSNLLIISVETPIDIEDVILCQFIYAGTDNKSLQFWDFPAECDNNISQSRLIRQFNLYPMLSGYFVWQPEQSNNALEQSFVFFLCYFDSIPDSRPSNF
jgi:hypothetical protein